MPSGTNSLLTENLYVTPIKRRFIVNCIKYFSALENGERMARERALDFLNRGFLTDTDILEISEFLSEPIDLEPTEEE